MVRYQDLLKKSAAYVEERSRFTQSVNHAHREMEQGMYSLIGSPRAHAGPAANPRPIVRFDPPAPVPGSRDFKSAATLLLLAGDDEMEITVPFTYRILRAEGQAARFVMVLREQAFSIEDTHTGFADALADAFEKGLDRHYGAPT